MNLRMLSAAFAASLAASFAVDKAHGIEIQATDARGIRAFPGEDPFLLDFLAIKAGTDDRTVLEFDLGHLPGALPGIQLVLPVRNIDADPPPGSIDVFTFVGDGVVEPLEFFAGDFFDTIPTRDLLIETLLLDVTLAAQEVIDTGGRFLGLRLSTTSADRFDLGELGRVPEPFLTTVPEPGTAGIFVSSIAVLLLARRWMGLGQPNRNSRPAL